MNVCTKIVFKQKKKKMHKPYIGKALSIMS
jgi:hypothetical protein